MTLYAGWTDRLCAATTTAATTIEIPYGQEWTDIPVTVSSLTLSWFQNTGKTSRQADMMKLTPYVGSATTSDFTFYQVGGSDNISAYKGAGEHTVGNSVSEALTATGQSGTLWVHIPQSVWENAAVGTYDVVNLAADRFHLFLQDNKLYYPSAEVTIRPFRAFFVLGSGLPDEARSIEIDFGEGETTHISLTPVPSPTGEGSEYYDLQGRRVKTPSKGGIYIHNGMKVAIK